MLKVILFDIDNTLLSFDAFVKESMKLGFDAFGIGPYRDEMYHTFHKINTALWQQIERGEITLEELKKRRWNTIFEALGLSADGVAFERYFRERLFASAIQEEGAMALLKYLHGKYTLCAASNGPYLQQVNRLKIGGMLPYFSDVFVSEEIGCSKPAEAFFNTCIERVSAKAGEKILPCEMMMVGDSLSSDMAGGMRAGMQTCFYNPAKKAIPCDLRIDYEVVSLADLQRIL